VGNPSAVVRAPYQGPVASPQPQDTSGKHRPRDLHQSSFTLSGDDKGEPCPPHHSSKRVLAPPGGPSNIAF
ncbi:hypothetical protein Z043_121416, partial [Scleropages formosus]